jgi:hypothetical protein
VDTFKYIGSIFISKKQIECDIKEKIMAVSQCFSSLNEVLGKRYISKSKKIKIYCNDLRVCVTIDGVWIGCWIY